MRKIPTLFVRNPDDMRHVTRDVHPACQWVIDGEGIATRKYDGTCVMFDGADWWARREVKPDKNPPPHFRTIEHDEVTSKTVGWEPIEQSAFVKYHAEALALDHRISWPIGTYELIGPRINGNPERTDKHRLVYHADAQVLVDVPRTFDGLAAVLPHLDGEGVVWHHLDDGRMAKLKRRDFPAARESR